MTIELSRQGLVVTRRLLGWQRRIEATLEQIDEFDEQEVWQQNDQPVLGIAIHLGTRQRKFGSSLTDGTRQWLVGELNRTLNRLRSR